MLYLTVVFHFIPVLFHMYNHATYKSRIASISNMELSLLSCQASVDLEGQSRSSDSSKTDESSLRTLQDPFRAKVIGEELSCELQLPPAKLNLNTNHRRIPILLLEFRFGALVTLLSSFPTIHLVKSVVFLCWSSSRANF